MAEVQTSYTSTIPSGYAGMVANGETSNRITRTVEDAGGLAFGKAAFRGSGDHGVTGTPAAGTFMGITIADQALPLSADRDADEYARYDSAALLNEGVIWVVAGEAVTDGAAAYVTSGGAIVDTATDNIAIPAVFDGTAASGALVRLRVRRS